ncbi:MAG: Arc family DNA binding domain-containing protein [Flavobacteriales bacterium CG03_land_8_20_14_0_80_35_15]|nr:Arc family DNA binding domain-containing protein [Zetaproteobacteria bacterium]NDK18545.1 Arc family DNA binding domain-containing protein [Flavobacteriales bacterium]OIO09107.1 MAG: Arc family DNA binding domain-containing protein [Flavobacteriaceae bacterium CG1_02_35_72]PIR14823.1 MAG: Arc family DNA binding domain-containing protein [Flavobacteriales bacterium CG11_big_fil_rev_8_21_14_0_20_35_7]PIV17489.1 MAG: Arc family DNA binding domain-containing protein [Flavobacteriales bacterium C
MSVKKAFALRINQALLKAVEKWAADEFRSTNGQIEWMLTKILKEAKRLPNEPTNTPENNQ